MWVSRDTQKNIKGDWIENIIEGNHSTAGKNKKEIENENEKARQFPVANDGDEDGIWRGQLSRRRGYYISSCSTVDDSEDDSNRTG